MPASRSAPRAARRDMTQPPRPCNDAMVGIPGTGPGTSHRRAAWARVAVAVAVLDTIAVVAVLVIAAEASIYLPMAETGTWINFIAAPAFPLLAAFMLRNRGRDPDRPPRQDRLAWLFLGFGALCAATCVLHVFVMYGLSHHGPAIAAVAWVYTWLWVGVPTGLLLACCGSHRGSARTPVALGRRRRCRLVRRDLARDRFLARPDARILRAYRQPGGLDRRRTGLARHRLRRLSCARSHRGGHPRLGGLAVLPR